MTALFIALWRWWLGRGEGGWPKKWRKVDATGKEHPPTGGTWFQYVLVVAGVFWLLSRSGSPWNVALTCAFVPLLLARWTGHTPVLYGPGLIPPADRLHGVEEFLYDHTGFISNDEARWWAFALLRYTVPSIPFALALSLQGHPAGWVVASTVPLIATYRLCWAEREWLTRIAPFYKSAGHIQFAEFIGWAWIGAAVALA